MNYFGILEGAYRDLLRNKMRSLLTVLGITIGIAAVICVVAIGTAGQDQVERQMSNLGDNYVWIQAGGWTVNGVRTGTHTLPTLTLADLIAIESQVPLIKLVSPNVDASVQVIYGNQNWFTIYRGVSPAYFDIKRWYPEQGAVFTDEDIENAAGVCVIGKTIRDQLFGAENPVGKVVRVGKLPCRVVAVLRPKGLSYTGQDQDDQIILPYTTAQKKLKGTVWLDDIVGSAVSQNAVRLAGQQAAAVLRDRHHLRPEEGDDFSIRNPEDVIQAQ
ncbi:MAG TPA: ABC transporter permease, partial [Rhizomicrobium sp.]|nr:ABC transporter permease [Rhizomicrobium sp.]